MTLRPFECGDALAFDVSNEVDRIPAVEQCLALRVVELDDSETDLLDAVRAGRDFLLADRA